MRYWYMWVIVIAIVVFALFFVSKEQERFAPVEKLDVVTLPTAEPIYPCNDKCS